MKNKTTTALTALEFALSQLSTDQKLEDEFSVDDFIQSLAAQGESISVSSATTRLNTLLLKKLLKKRKARVGGRMMNLYSKV